MLIGDYYLILLDESGYWGDMSDSIDLSGDGGVVKTILRKAKADALCPSDDLPLVDGMVCSCC